LLHKKAQGAFIEGVVDLMSAVKPQLAVVDAIICQEGVGPIFGKPVEMNLIVTGKDLVAVDATCARIIGYEPAETLLTVNAAARGLGVMDPDKIEILGEPLDQVKRRFLRSIEDDPVKVEGFKLGEPLDQVKRRFLRSIEDDPVKVEGFKLIHAEATCTGCRNTVMSVLVDMRNADQLMYLPGVTVVTGGASLPEGTLRDEIVTVGLCMPEESQTERHVKGCPPNNALVVKAIIGDRAEVKRMYAKESLDKTEG
jgi:hypothetical protein